MKWLDRVLLSLLVVGVWAAVFNTNSTFAHNSGDTVSCSISGSALGDVDSGDVSGGNLDSSTISDGYINGGYVSGLNLDSTSVSMFLGVGPNCNSLW